MSINSMEQSAVADQGLQSKLRQCGGACIAVAGFLTAGSGLAFEFLDRAAAVGIVPDRQAAIMMLGGAVAGCLGWRSTEN